MTSYELLALLSSHVLVGAIAWEVCHRRCARKIVEAQLRCLKTEAEVRQTVSILHEVREHFQTIERSLIDAQLLMEHVEEQGTQNNPR